jgi:hypothetical protein
MACSGASRDIAFVNYLIFRSKVYRRVLIVYSERMSRFTTYAYQPFVDSDRIPSSLQDWR